MNAPLASAALETGGDGLVGGVVGEGTLLWLAEMLLLDLVSPPALETGGDGFVGGFVGEGPVDTLLWLAEVLLLDLVSPPPLPDDVVMVVLPAVGGNLPPDPVFFEDMISPHPLSTYRSCLQKAEVEEIRSGNRAAQFIRTWALVSPRSSPFVLFIVLVQQFTSIGYF